MLGLNFDPSLFSGQSNQVVSMEGTATRQKTIQQQEKKSFAYQRSYAALKSVFVTAFLLIASIFLLFKYAVSDSYSYIKGFKSLD